MSASDSIDRQLRQSRRCAYANLRLEKRGEVGRTSIRLSRNNGLQRWTFPRRERSTWISRVADRTAAAQAVMAIAGTERLDLLSPAIQQGAEVTSIWYASMARTDLRDWLHVLIYLFAASASAQAARHAALAHIHRARLFWCMSALTLMFLGANEVLDLQALLTDLGRWHAWAFGWYGEHRRAQHLFFVAFGMGSVSAGIVMMCLAWRSGVPVLIALLGHGLIALFVLERAAAIAHVDDIIDMAIFDHGWELLELTGPLIVSFAAIVYARTRRDNSRLP